MAGERSSAQGLDSACGAAFTRRTYRESRREDFGEAGVRSGRRHGRGRRGQGTVGSRDNFRLRGRYWCIAADLGVYRFPRDPDGKTIYCNIEGISWLSASEVVVVSDKTKGDQKARCRGKDQSVHVFGIPAAVD